MDGVKMSMMDPVVDDEFFAMVVFSNFKLKQLED
jgi:hypothetical protein